MSVSAEDDEPRAFAAVLTRTDLVPQLRLRDGAVQPRPNPPAGGLRRSAGLTDTVTCYRPKLADSELSSCLGGSVRVMYW